MEPFTEFKCEDVEVKVKIETQDIDTGVDDYRSQEYINFVKCEIVDAECLENIKLENNMISAPNNKNIENIDLNETNANASSSERYLDDARQNMENMFYCSKCDKRFTQKYPNGEKPYQCSECGKCFTIKISLVQQVEYLQFQKEKDLEGFKANKEASDKKFKNEGHITAKEQCLGCKNDISNILMHLCKKTVCKTFYDIDLLKRQANERKLEKNRARQATYKQRQKEKDLEGFKAKKAASDKKFKNKMRISAKEQCLCCKNDISNILMHLCKKPACKTFYNIDLLKMQAKERKLEKKRARQATYLQRQKENDLEKFKANKAASDKRFKNKRRISAKEQCLSCKNDISNILMHLCKKPVCKTFYDLDLLKRQANEKKLEKNRARQATYKQRQREKDLEGFKANKCCI